MTMVVKGKGWMCVQCECLDSVAGWSSTQPVHGVGCWSSVRSSSCGCKLHGWSSEQPLGLSEIQDCYNCRWSSTQPVHGVGCWSSVRSSSCGCKLHGWSSEQPLGLSEIQDCYNCSFSTNLRGMEILLQHGV